MKMEMERDEEKIKLFFEEIVGVLEEVFHTHLRLAPEEATVEDMLKILTAFVIRQLTNIFSDEHWSFKSIDKNDVKVFCDQLHKCCIGYIELEKEKE
jgi:hypothetical protein